MGLDWVVLAKEQDGVEINPTEIIGAKRASRDDPEVMDELRRIWEAGDQSQSFDAFVEGVVSQAVAPIVITFGSGFEAAIPAVRAEVQYYGFRGKALEPKGNRVSALAERNGHDMSWLYGDLECQGDIEAKVAQLAQIIGLYRRGNPDITGLAESYYGAWRQRNAAEMEKIEQASENDPDAPDHLFELFAYFGAIDWLRFWSDKGFKIAADF